VFLCSDAAKLCDSQHGICIAGLSALSKTA